MTGPEFNNPLFPTDLSNSQNPDETVIFIRSRPRKVSDLEAYLRAIRTRYKLTPQEFAELIGIGHPTYHWMELSQQGRGISPRNKHVAEKLTDALEKLTEEGDPHAEALITLATYLTLKNKVREKIEDLLIPFPGKIVFLKDSEHKAAYKYMRLKRRRERRSQLKLDVS